MALTDRMAEAIGGPGGGSTWYDDGPQFTLQNHTSISATVTANELILGIVPAVNTFVQANPSSVDVLGSSNIIQAVYGGQLVLTTTLAVQAQLAILIYLRRMGVVVGGGPFMGWLYTGAGTYTGGTGTPAMTTAFAPTVMPFITSNTALLPNPRNAATTTAAAYMPLQPLDVITCLIVTQTGSIPLGVGNINLTVV